VAADVLAAAVAAAVAKKTRHRAQGADFESIAQHVFGLVALAAAAFASVISQHRDSLHHRSLPRFEFGATFGARRKYLSISFGFAVPTRSRKKSSAARKEPTFSATAAAMNWFSDTPSWAANSAATFFTEAGSFNG
jgi:hypothetical protein